MGRDGLRFKRTSHYTGRTGIPCTEDLPGETTLVLRGPEPHSDLPVGSRYFPSITSYPDNNEHVEFEYVGYLENGSDCTTLRARTLMDPSRDIVVKFVDQYGQGAHELLAESDLAPRLLHHGPVCLKDGEPSYRSISMVVVDGTMLAVAGRHRKGWRKFDRK